MISAESRLLDYRRNGSPAFQVIKAFRGLGMREHRSPATGVGAGICICHSEKEACAMDVQGSDDASYKVVVNHEEQYSIWPAARENALGW